MLGGQDIDHRPERHGCPLHREYRDRPDPRRLQSCQDVRYKEREAAGSKKDATPLVPVNIFIEEAHEFLSDQRIRQMPNLFEQVVRIARRGRKRHLGIVFITQFRGICRTRC